MSPGLFRRRDADSLRSLMEAEREDVRRSLSDKTADRSLRKRTYWKPLGGRGWTLLLPVPFLAHFVFGGEPGAAVFATLVPAAGMLLMKWLHDRKMADLAEQYKPVLALRDSERDEYGRQG